MNYHQCTNEELMKLYVLHDFNAFNCLYNRTSPQILGFLYKKLNQKEIAEDLLQLVFQKIHRNREKYDPKQKFNAWAFTITKNTLIDYFRQKQNSMHREFDEAHHAVDETKNQQIVQMELDQHLNKLKEVEKTAIQLRYIEDKEFKEVGEILNKNESAVRQLISRTMKKLKKMAQKSYFF